MSIEQGFPLVLVYGKGPFSDGDVQGVQVRLLISAGEVTSWQRYCAVLGICHRGRLLMIVDAASPGFGSVGEWPLIVVAC